MSFQRYPEYKDSGVEWLGQVPAHWAVKRFQRCVEIAEGQVDPEDPRYSQMHLIAPNHVEAGTGTLLSLESAGEQGAESGKYLCNAGDVVYSKIRPALRKVCIAPERCLCSADMYPLRACSGLTNAFLVWFMLSEQFSSLAVLESQRVAMPKINRESLKDISVVVPPSHEQLAIAAFLNRETAKIDALVGEQERLIELLQEKRQAVISHAVTKGLNPDAPMKESGIECLGKVPAHWRISKMKWVAEMDSGHTPDKKVSEYWENGEIPWVSLNDTSYIRDNDYISETAYSVTPLGLENSSAHLLPPRAVVFSRDATIGRCAITTRPMAVSQHFIAWICGDSIISEYLLLRLRSMTQELESLTTGATLKTIGMPEVRTLVTPVPPIAEQEAIIARCADQARKVDTLIAEAQRAIDLLQERRTALISATVTGQIDVRSAKPDDLVIDPDRKPRNKRTRAAKEVTS